MIELKPCPFCGGKASFADCHIAPRGYVKCDNGCCEQPGLYLTKEEAKRAWNKRAIPDDLTVCGYDVKSLIALSLVAAEAGVTQEDLKDFARNWEAAYRFVAKESLRKFEEAIGAVNGWGKEDV